ncbi:pyridoxal-phosphate dependent enzyme [Actinopolymorpha sp. B9G3]|uniref:threonine ammonia-lyase n=1 Tax=Actinopolymorpha sp. B9G3 TaxID=3158970 RepID=UPI0032D91345
MRLPCFTDVLRAGQTLRPHLPPTPAWSYPALDAACGAHVVVKHENVQPTGAFKVRGGLTLLATMPAAERDRGVVTYSTGNHAQSIAYAAREFRAPCTVVMPEGANESKHRAVEALGATVVLRGTTLEESATAATLLASRCGARFVSPADEPALIAGVGTAYLELLTAAPDLDVIVVPVGGGSNAAAASLVVRTLAPHIEVIGVQSDAAPAAHDSWHAGHLVERPNRTEVEGLSTGRGFALTQQLMRDGLAGFVLVSDNDIRAAQRLLLSHAHTLAEGAGAAGLAVVLGDPPRFAGRQVGIACTGANASLDQLRSLLAA